MLVATAMGLATLASGWSSYQSALWGGIQVFRLVDAADVGREIAVKEVALGQQHVLDLFLLEHYLEARDQSSPRTDFLFGRLAPELRAATRTWLDSHPGDNPGAARSPFHIEGYAQAGTEVLEGLRKKQAATYVDANRANKISDNYVRITVFFGLVLFLAGISAVMKVTGPKRGLIAISFVTLLCTLFVLSQMPLATE